MVVLAAVAAGLWLLFLRDSGDSTVASSSTSAPESATASESSPATRSSPTRSSPTRSSPRTESRPSTESSPTTESTPTPESAPGIPPATVPPEGLGDDPLMDQYAQACYDGDMTACDSLFRESEPDSAYELYGGTCAGRQAVEVATTVYCTDAFPTD